IVVHAHHGVVIAAGRLVKKAVCRIRAVSLDAFAFGRLHSGENRLFLLIAKDSFFAAMGIQSSDGDAGMRNSKEVSKGLMGEVQGRANSITTQTPRDSSEGYVAGNQNYPELFPDEHHAALGRAAELSQQFRMTRIVIAGILENAFADGSGGHSIGDAGERKL